MASFISIQKALPVPLIPTAPETPVVGSYPAVIPSRTNQLKLIRPESQPLTNTRHERFAQLVAEGDPAGVAYVKVYRASAQCGSASASRLLRNVNVRERISGLQKEAAKGTVLTLAHKREILHDIVTSPLSDVNEHSPLCQYAEVGKNGKVKKMTMPDKLRALELDAKLAGELNVGRARKKTGKPEYEAMPLETIRLITDLVHGKHPQVSEPGGAQAAWLLGP